MIPRNGTLEDAKSLLPASGCKNFQKLTFLSAHKAHTIWWQDVNKPEQFGFTSKYLLRRAD
jgi:hypothetical protein